MCRKQNVLSVFAVDFQVVSELRANLDFASSTLPPAACSTPAEQRRSNEGYSSYFFRFHVHVRISLLLFILLLACVVVFCLS